MTLKENLKKIIELNPHSFQIFTTEKGFINDLTNDDVHEVEPGSLNEGWKWHILFRVESKTYRFGSNIPFPPIKEWYNEQ